MNIHETSGAISMTCNHRDQFVSYTVGCIVQIGCTARQQVAPLDQTFPKSRRPYSIGSRSERANKIPH